MQYKLNGKFQTEAKFTSAYLKSFKGEKNINGWAFKIPDIGRTIKPFDWFGICKEGVIFCETKIMKKNIFKFNQIRNNQFTALKRIFLLAEKFGLENLIKTYVQIYSLEENKYCFIDFSLIMYAEKDGFKKIEITDYETNNFRYK